MTHAWETLRATLHLLLATVCLTSSIDTWYKLNVQCLSESASLHQSVASTELHCTSLGSWKSAVGIFVAQFNQVSRLCSLFLYQSVCRQMVAGQSVDCRVFIRSPVNPQSISAKLSGLWLGDSTSRFDNAVCQVDSDTNRFDPVDNVQWTGYGANFDGLSAHLVLTKGNFDFIGGLTWLLRLKRQPQQQVFLAFVDCNNVYGTSLEVINLNEYTPSGSLSVSLRYLSTISNYFYRTHTFMTLNSDEWIDIAFTVPPMASTNGYNFYYNDAFISKTGITASIVSNKPVFSRICAYFGRHTSTNFMFNGTLRAIGAANVSMSEAEIRDFFKTVNYPLYSPALL